MRNQSLKKESVGSAGTDALNAYMIRVGRVAPLARERELEVAKRIDEGRRLMAEALFNAPMTLREVIRLGKLLKAWLDEIKGQMTKNKAASLEEKNSLLASRPAKERAKLAPVYESIWLDTHYRIVDRLIEQERVVIKLFAEKLDKDKALGAASDAVQKLLDKKSYLTPKGARHGPGG